MRQQFSRSKEASSSSSSTRRPSNEVATERDPLLSSSSSNNNSGRAPAESHHQGKIRVRRSSRSPATLEERQDNMGRPTAEGYARAAYAQDYAEGTSGSSATSSYELQTSDIASLPQHQQNLYAAGVVDSNSRSSSARRQASSFSRQGSSSQQAARASSRGAGSSGLYRSVETTGGYQSQNTADGPPLLEIPEEVYIVRKAALKVLKPLVASWLVASVGFAVSVLLGMARWTRLMSDLPYWFILLPSWCSHVALLWCHIKSAHALSKFIAEANDNRQRPDSTDAPDRTEYLPLLQRALKFGFKTGMLSFCIFVLEVLLYIKIARNSISMLIMFIPLWLLVGGAILDGIVCKTQHVMRVLCWVLIFTAMVLTVLKMDYSMNVIQWRMVVRPIVTVLSICSATLIYIVYGHQVGYYRLTEAQLTAGILYSMSALICVVLVVLVGEIMPFARPVEIETRVFFVIMAPLVVCLVGMGAWAVSRDEFGRLLLYGGQTAVHPMKLRWERDGWTSVQSKGVTIIPMFGEVSFCPLEGSDKPCCIEICPCCSCYPYDDEDEEGLPDSEKASWQSHPYLVPTTAARAPISRRASEESSLETP